MIWFANVLLLLSMILLGRNAARSGWIISAVGNLIWVGMTLSRGQYDYASLSITFTIVATYNFVKAVKYANQPGVRAARDYCKNRVSAQ